MGFFFFFKASELQLYYKWIGAKNKINKDKIIIKCHNHSHSYLNSYYHEKNKQINKQTFLFGWHKTFLSIRPSLQLNK